MLLTSLAGCEGSRMLGTKLVSTNAEQPLLTRQILFGNPVRSQGRISPDGKWVSWLAPLDGVLNIWVAPADDPEAARVLTQDTGRGIQQHFWAYNSSMLLYTQDKGGNENNHLFAVGLDGVMVRDLTPIADGARATVAGLNSLHPNRVLVGLNERDPQRFDLYEIDLVSGERNLVFENPRFANVVVDRMYRPRLVYEQNSGGSARYLKLDGEGNLTPFIDIAAEDVNSTRVIGFNVAGTHFYMVDTRQRNTAALVSVEFSTGSQEVLGFDPAADVADVLLNPASYVPEAYSINRLRSQWHPIGAAVASDLQRIDETLAGDFQILSTTVDGSRWVVYSDAPVSPGEYHLYDRSTGELELLLKTRPELANDELLPMYATEIPARDGLRLVSYLTLPALSDPDGKGRPVSPVPMVLYVHGGPWVRDEYGYNSVHQWLANRGYAVLSVNYRGSSGFGKDFLNAAVKEFAGKMHDDLIDAVRWAVHEGITKQETVAIMGGSYGGYATLIGVTFTPDVFTCGVDIVGPSNLVTLVESFPEYWKPYLAGTWYKFVGNPENQNEREDMLARSPLGRVGDIKVPLLIGQGGNDPRVTKRESDQLVSAMQKKGLPVTYVNYPDEGHGFVRPENRLSFFGVAEGFLATCLGGDYQPLGDDLDGSSMEVLHGTDYIQGLKEALREVEP